MNVVSIKSSMADIMKVTFMITRSFEVLILLFVVLLYQKVNVSECLPRFVATNLH
jgi:hypothetical protein